MKRIAFTLGIVLMFALGALARVSAQQFSDQQARSVCVGTALSTCSTIGHARVTLTSTQVKALHGTPIALVAAPGSGKVVIVDRITFGSTFVSAAYTGSNNLEFRYTDGAGDKVTADIAAATLNFSSGTKRSTVDGVTAELVPVANAAVVVVVPIANPGAGDSPVTFSVLYHVETIP